MPGSSNFRLHRTVIAEGQPERWLAATHGIFGRGANLRTLARKITSQRPDWGVLLVDLRGHGRSLEAPPPHTIDAAAADVRELIAGEAPERRVAALLGHSLGGKVMLRARSSLETAPEATFVIDSSPASDPAAGTLLLQRLEIPDSASDVLRVLAMLDQLPRQWRDRREFESAVMERGFSRMLGSWLAMNLEREGGSYCLALDPAVMRELLTSYFFLDAWGDVEKPAGALHVVIAERSESIGPAQKRELETLAARHSWVEPVSIDTGHWVHAEDPDGLAALVAARLPGR